MSGYQTAREDTPFGVRYVARFGGVRIGSAPTQRQAERIILDHKNARGTITSPIDARIEGEER